MLHLAREQNRACMLRAFLKPRFYSECIPLHEDSAGGQSLAENPRSSSRSTHIDVRCHFTQDLVKTGKVSVDFVDSKGQHADVLTKTLGLQSFSDHGHVFMNLAN